MENKLDFKPMPKRFMVWDKLSKDWVADYIGKLHDFDVFDVHSLAEIIKDRNLELSNIVVVQSTNLFAVGGEEIFEGSIISSHSGDLIGVVKQHKSGEWRIWWDNIEGGSTVLSEPNVYPLTLVGHILSKPELLEE